MNSNRTTRERSVAGANEPTSTTDSDRVGVASGGGSVTTPCSTSAAGANSRLTDMRGASSARTTAAQSAAAQIAPRM